MAADLAPRIIVLALGAGLLGFPDALPLLLQVAGQSPLRDIFICAFAMAVVTAQVLGTMLLVRFVRKEARATAAAGAGGGAPAADRFSQVTLAVSLVVAFLVFACLVVASGAGGLGLGLGMVYLVADIARKNPVIAVLVTGGAAAVLLCTRPLLRVAVFREEDDSHDSAAAASTSSTGTWRFANMTQVTSFTGAAAAFLLAVSGGLYILRGRGFLVDVAAVVGAMLLLARFTRRARNAADAGGGRPAPTSAADTFGKLTTLAPYMAIVSSALICLVLTTYPCSA